MFKFNELSDLISGELVTPVKKIPEGVLCIDKNGDQIVCTLEDFDFDKTPEERIFVVVDDNSDDLNKDNSGNSSDDSSENESLTPINSSDDSSEENPSGEPTPINNSSEESSSEETSKKGMSELNKAHWIEDSYFKYSLCKKMGLDPNSFRKLLIWEE